MHSKTLATLVTSSALLVACGDEVDYDLEADTSGTVTDRLIDGELEPDGPLDPTQRARNAAVSVGGCSGTLVAPDMVLTAAHCTTGAAWEDDPQVGKETWRPMSPRLVTVGADLTTPAYQGVARWANQVGFDDIVLLMLDAPVPASVATPAKVMSADDYGDFGPLWLVDLEFRGYGGSCTDGNLRNFSPLNMNSLQPRGVNSFGLTLESDAMFEHGDSGGGVWWWNPDEEAYYVLGVFVGGPAIPDDDDGTCSSNDDCEAHYACCGTEDAPWPCPSAGTCVPDKCDTHWQGYGLQGHAIGTFRTGNGADKPDISAWLAGDVVLDQPRTRFQPVQGPDRWHDWFCLAGETCSTGDFDGDGKQDIITFTHGSSADVYVGLSYGYRTWSGLSSVFPQAGNGFESRRWHHWFGPHDETVGVMDFDGDGRDDIFAGSPWSVWFSRSTTLFGNGVFDVSFEALTSGICNSSTHTCIAGNVRGDAKDELISIRHADGDTTVYEVERSGGTWTLVPSSMNGAPLDGECLAPHRCELVDYDGDGFEDVVSFRYDGGDVAVALTKSFWVWGQRHTFFGSPQQVLTGQCYEFGSYVRDCDIGDVDGDGAVDDIAVFDRSWGHVDVGIGDGSGTTMTYDWTASSQVCAPGHTCELADVTGDGLSDLVGFVGSTVGGSRRGDVYVQSSTNSF